MPLHCSGAIVRTSRTYTRQPVAITLLVCALQAAGCASAPTRPAVASLECSQLPAEIVRTERERRAALEGQVDSWKLVLPLVVAARFAIGMSQVSESDGRLSELRAQFKYKDCARHG
jgi:hypothetical protein